MPRYRFLTADVFTTERFGWNQLAVLPDARGLTGEQMLAVTREFNYSESVFVLPATYGMRVVAPAGSANKNAVVPAVTVATGTTVTQDVVLP